MKVKYNNSWKVSGKAIVDPVGSNNQGLTIAKSNVKITIVIAGPGGNPFPVCDKTSRANANKITIVDDKWFLSDDLFAYKKYLSLKNEPKFTENLSSIQSKLKSLGQDYKFYAPDDSDHCYLGTVTEYIPSTKYGGENTQISLRVENFNKLSAAEKSEALDLINNISF
ncbi:MAG: hypothetical protein WCK98_00595 [bacterium]